MKDEELDEFPWSILFLGTAASSLLFNIALKKLDGNFSSLLFLISVIAAILGTVNWVAKTLVKRSVKKRRSRELIS